MKTEKRTCYLLLLDDDLFPIEQEESSRESEESSR